MTRLNVATYIAWAAVTTFGAALFAIDLYPRLTNAVGQINCLILLVGFLIGARALGREISIATTTLLRRRRKQRRKAQSVSLK